MISRFCVYRFGQFDILLFPISKREGMKVYWKYIIEVNVKIKILN